jgi:bacterioferritin-associated ferredoxin
MIICVCKNVSDRDIANAVAEGCASFRALQRELELGKSCGTCLESARECFAGQKSSSNLQVA